MNTEARVGHSGPAVTRLTGGYWGGHHFIRLLELRIQIGRLVRGIQPGTEGKGQGSGPLCWCLDTPTSHCFLGLTTKEEGQGEMVLGAGLSTLLAQNPPA